MQQPVGDVDPAFRVDGEVVRELQHRLRALRRGGRLAPGFLLRPTAAHNEKEQDEEGGVPAHRCWYTEEASAVTRLAELGRKLESLLAADSGLEPVADVALLPHEDVPGQRPGAARSWKSPPR